MSLNVKNPEAHRLAEAIANATGETLTHAVIRSLEERLERLNVKEQKPEKLIAGIRAIARRSSSHIKQLNRPYIEHGDFLYDEHGLPK